jgi:hypothetical protein
MPERKSYNEVNSANKQPRIYPKTTEKKMKTLFVLQGNHVLSKHYSMEAAQQFIIKFCKTFRKYPVIFYRVQKLMYPKYWQKGDTPEKQYYI